MSWWAVLGGTILVALSFGAGSLVSGRRLDEAYTEGWSSGEVAGFELGHRTGYDLAVAEDEGAMFAFGVTDCTVPAELAAPADEVPHLGEFVPGEVTHVSERKFEPLRSTGGFIPELAADEEVMPPEPVPRADVPAKLVTTPAPVSPSAGAGLEPPGSGGLMEDPEVRQSDVPHHAVIPSAGPGADPLFAPLDDDSAFALIRWELRRLAWMASEPFTPTGWEAA